MAEVASWLAHAHAWCWFAALLRCVLEQGTTLVASLSTRVCIFPMGTHELNSGVQLPCDGLAPQPQRSSNTPSHLMPATETRITSSDMGYWPDTEFTCTLPQTFKNNLRHSMDI